MTDGLNREGFPAAVTPATPGQAALRDLIRKRWNEVLTAPDDPDVDYAQASLAAETALGALAMQEPMPAPGVTPPGEPLTHFFHCWRFSDHHACAVALIERQGEENRHELFRAGTAEDALRDIMRAIEDVATGTDAEVAAAAGAVLAIARRALNNHAAAPASSGEPWTIAELAAALDSFYAWFTVTGGGARVQGQLLGADAEEFARALHAQLDANRAHRQ